MMETTYRRSGASVRKSRVARFLVTAGLSMLIATSADAAAPGCSDAPTDPLCIVMTQQDAAAASATEAAEAMLIDDDGDAATSPLYVMDISRITGPSTGVVVGTPWTAVALPKYAIDPPTPATADSYATDDQGGAVKVGSCDFFGPEIFPIYDREAEGPKYLYSADIGARCSGTTQVYCYVQIHRVKDQKITPGTPDTDPTWCHSGANTPHYAKRAKHYARGVIRATTAPGRFWGSGRLPGWDCTGQGTRTLECKRNSRTVS